MPFTKLLLAVTAADSAPLNLLDRTSYQTPRQLTVPGKGGGYPSYGTSPYAFPIRCLAPNAPAKWNAISLKLFGAALSTGPWGLAQTNVVLIVRYTDEASDSYVDVVGGNFDLLDPAVPNGERWGMATLLCLPGRRGQAATYGPFRLANGDRDQTYCLTVTGGAGTFTLTKGANTTSAQAWNVSAATLQTQLQGLASIGANNCIVYGSTTGTTSTYIIRFAGSLNNQNVTLTTNGGAGGASAALSTSTSGAIWLPGIPGTQRGVVRVKVDDKSGGAKVINDIILGSVSHPLLTATDIVPVLGVTPQAPGTAHANAASRRGTESRLTTTSTWSAICRASLPASPAKSNGRRRIIALCKASDAIIGQPQGVSVSTLSGAGSIGTATITATIVPYNGSAPYVAGVNQLGQPSAFVTQSTQLLVAGGTQQVALTPLFYDDFELNSLVRWSPGPVAYANVTNGLAPSGSGGSSSVTTGTTFKDTGTYGCQLTAVSPNDAGSLHHSSMAELAATSPAMPASKILGSHARIKIQTETSNTATSASDARGLAHWMHSTTTAGFGLATLDGTNWGFYQYSALAGFQGVGLATSFVLVGSGTFTLAAGFHDSEITVDNSQGTSAAIRLTIDGVTKSGTFAGQTPQAFGCTAVATSPVNTTQATETIWVDTFSIEDGYLGTGASISGFAYIYNWEASQNAGGYLFEYNAGNVWNSFDVGNVLTYTLTTLLPTGVVVNRAPPVTAPALVPSQIRAAVAYQANTAPTFTYGQPKQFRLANGKREWLDLGGFSQGDRPRWEQAALPSLVQIEGINANGGPTIDVEAVAVIDEAPVPQKGLRAELAAWWNTTQEEWDYDTRPDMEASCVLRSLADSSVDGEAALTGPLTLAPGGNWLVALLAEQDGSNNAVADAVNLEADLTVTILPSFDVSGGV